MKLSLAVVICLVQAVNVSAQKEGKSIKRENVTRIIKTLSTDDMMGRPASDPNKIEKATAFIENEFRSIGLSKLSGLTGYRQEFMKDKVNTNYLNVSIGGSVIPSQKLCLYSERTQINTSSGFLVRRIEYDSTIGGMRSFLGRLGLRDTTHAIVLISEKYSDYFEEVKDLLKTRFVNNRKGAKVFVLGDYGAQTYSIKASQELRPTKMANVVGVLPGKAKPDEFVIFSAHYDHIGIQRPIDGDSIANGADDDASGTTAVIELARYFKKANSNNRTLLFVTFTAEEIGGFGSRYFSEQVDPGKVVAMFNIEMIGKPSKFGRNAAFITGYERSDFGEILQKNLTGTQFMFHPDPYPEQGLFNRSDNATFARLGVPAHSISTDQIDTDKLYHTVNDEFESLDVENILSTIRAIALSSNTIVSGADTPKRIDKTTVR